jgi:hypothetical protein
MVALRKHNQQSRCQRGNDPVPIAQPGSAKPSDPPRLPLRQLCRQCSRPPSAPWSAVAEILDSPRLRFRRNDWPTACHWVFGSIGAYFYVGRGRPERSPARAAQPGARRCNAVGLHLFMTRSAADTPACVTARALPSLARGPAQGAREVGARIGLCGLHVRERRLAGAGDVLMKPDVSRMAPWRCSRTEREIEARHSARHHLAE